MKKDGFGRYWLVFPFGLVCFPVHPVSAASYLPPSTGYDDNMLVWIILFALAAAATIVLVLLFLQKKYKSDGGDRL